MQIHQISVLRGHCKHEPPQSQIQKEMKNEFYLSSLIQQSVQLGQVSTFTKSNGLFLSIFGFFFKTQTLYIIQLPDCVPGQTRTNRST